MTKRNILATIMLVLALTLPLVVAQTTEFTYQGKLNDGANVANANYDFEFRLFDAASGGTQLGSTLARSNTTVSQGVFSVSLDFASVVPVFPGSDRYLEIALRPAGSGGFTTLSPRQRISSTPYAVKALNADNATNAVNAAIAATATTATTAANAQQLGGVAASQFVQTNDARLTDARPPTPGSTNYIQNGTAIQAASNFNITGTGTANVINAATQYNIGGNRVLSASGANNLFAGVGAGQANTGGFANAFSGSEAGLSNTTGSFNSLFGKDAGRSITTGSRNSFFGANAGRATTTAGNNSFFGDSAGLSNTTGEGNSFFGQNAGISNTTGANNSFVGQETGSSNTIGVSNSFFGYQAGKANTTASANSFFGQAAGTANTDGNFNSFFGRSAGSANTSGDDNAFFGHTAGLSSTGDGNSFFGKAAGRDSANGTFNSFFGYSAGNANTTGDNNTLIGAGADLGSDNLTFATAVGAGSVASLGSSIYLGRSSGTDAVRIPGATIIDGSLVVKTMGSSSGAVDLCINSADRLSLCAPSSRRYKSNIKPSDFGLDLVKRLNPVTFDWIDGGAPDFGLVAEEVADVEPLLAMFRKGQVEGVRYDRLGVVLINAVKEQQTQIERQQKQLELQRTENEALKARLLAIERAMIRRKPRVGNK